MLYVPPPSLLNVWRLVFWFALSAPATREYYAYFTDARVKRMGPNLWLAVACAVAELALVVKGATATPFPPGAQIHPRVLGWWAAAGGAFGLWCVLKFGGVMPTTRWRAVLLNSLLVVACACLAAIAIGEDVGAGLAPTQPDAPVSHRPSAGPFDS